MHLRGQRLNSNEARSSTAATHAVRQSRPTYLEYMPIIVGHRDLRSALPFGMSKNIYKDVPSLDDANMQPANV